jgi:release factor H-coupled RctB family protein
MNTSTETNVRLIASARSWIEPEALRQLLAAAQLPGVRHTVGLPDLHPGKFSPIGAAFVTEGVIYPHLIGGDIGCGMALFKTELPRRSANRVGEWAGLRFDLEHPWEGDVQERLTNEGLCTTPFADSFGTLGGSNHFAELQAVEKVIDPDALAALGLAKDELVALVHSGSHGLGQSALEIYLEGHGANGAHADSDAATSYLLLHDYAVNWARASRALIAQRFIGALGGAGVPVLDSCHNSISCRSRGNEALIANKMGPAPDGAELEGERSLLTSTPTMLWLHRKGAAPSDNGPLVIPGSRGTFSYLVQPAGDQSANAWSVAHGAGRKWARSESRLRVRRRFHRDELVQTGLGGRVICEERDLLYEEAPMAYKSIETVIGDLVEAGLVSVIATLRPLLTYKTRKLRR